jgi:uncharacterized protein (TIGR02266 family)
MATGRGPKGVLGVTLILCGAALLFLAIHRQAEIFADATALPSGKSSAMRTLAFKTYHDVETWAEAIGSIVLLAGAGVFLAASRRVSRGQAEEASARARLAEAESVTAQTRSLLFEQRAKTDLEIETMSAQIQSLLSELTVERERSSGPAARIENGGRSDGAPLAPGMILEPTPPIAPIALENEELESPDPDRGPAPSLPPPRPNSKRELRGTPRYVAHVEVDFESDSHFYTGLSQNVSEGGLFIATYAPRPVGTEIDLTLKLPGPQGPMRTHGTVRWIRDFSATSDAVPGMGLHLHLDDDALPRVRRFLSTRPPLFFDEG